jgi:sec-independent protein translocase protein TatB
VFDINPGELLILLVVAVVVIGPERLPKYAAELAKLVRYARGFARNAREQVREELGEDFDDIDWQALDPRRYDPRRIVREALLDDDDEPQVSDRAPNVPDAMRPDDDGPHGATAAGLAADDDGGVPAPRPSSAYDADAT